VLLLALGWLVQAGLRVWFGRMQVGPLANPDETAYLVAARVLAGGPAADLSNSTMYQGGYPLLLAPVYWFTSNPTTVYHAMLAFGVCVAAVSLVALTQMTSQVSRADSAQEQGVHVPASALRPGQQVALASGLNWAVAVPEVFQVSWTELQFFDPASQPPPAGVTAVETSWAGGPAQASWPHAPAGWHVVASNQAGKWVLWQKA
jgi:hypothetical protein